MKTMPIISVPFDSEGNIDEQSYINTLRYLDSVVTEAILFGIASEYSKLTEQEKIKLVKMTAEFKGKMKVYYSITDHSLEVAKLTIDKYEKYNPDGYMILGPFMYSPGKENIIKHIVEVANYSLKPVIVQVAPKETGCNFSFEDLNLIYRATNCKFKIEGPQIFEFIAEFKNRYPNIELYNGYAGIYIDKMLDININAVIPGCSFIEVYMDLIKIHELDKEMFMERFAEVKEYLFNWMEHTEKIIAVEKYILYKRGIISTPYCRMPYYQLNNKELCTIDKFISIYCKVSENGI